MASKVYAQPAATNTKTTATVEAKAKGEGKSPMGGPAWLSNMALPAIMFGMIYLLIWRPQQKKQKEHDALLKSLQRGAIVRTSGGIRGEIVELGDNDVQLMIADRVKINVTRNHISHVEPGATSLSK